MPCFLTSIRPFDLTRLARGLAAAALAAGAVGQAQAAGVPGLGTWETTLQGRDLDGDTANGFEAYYDTAQNITWLADANYAFTSGYTSAANGGVAPYTLDTNAKWTDGRMGWDAAKSWAANLNINGVTGWRLPNMVDTGKPVMCLFVYSGTNCGYNVSTSTSELAHLYFVTLGNKSSYSPSGNFQPGFGLLNAGPFKNVLQNGRYWFGVESAQVTDGAWSFDGGYGFQGDDYKGDGLYAWPVRPGDVAAVPEPSACALMLLGLGATLWVRGRRQR
jgi:PEP-CTERM motif